MPTDKKGFFITIEGIEGVGKSTAANYIQSLLAEHSRPYVTTREPGGTEVAEAIRKILLVKRQEPVYPETELLLFFAGRMQHIQQVILPALAKGAWVICDRFTDASYAYQCGGRQMDESFVRSLEQNIQKELQPDLTLLLDAPHAVGHSRIEKRGETDRIEQEREAFFRRVREKYLQRATLYAHRYRVIDADKTLEEVQQQIKTALNEFLQSHDMKSL